MDIKQVDNVNVDSVEVLTTPAEMRAQLPLTETAFNTVIEGRRQIQAILDRKDPRLFVVVGPCSIHDPAAAMDYARRLKALALELADALLLVMRVYFEKPRTTVGWKGLINDPDMDDSFHIAKGLRLGRGLLLDINALGLPAGSEALDPVSPQYLSDLMSWSAIGARTTESQTHREMSSALSMPVGFKNGTDGSVEVALNALESAGSPHHFLGVNQQGQTAVIRTKGNKYGHVILRGGSKGPNFDSVQVAQVDAALAKRGLRRALVVDCSHANSNKDHNLQPMVLDNVVAQVSEGQPAIVGAMVESNLHPGKQAIPKDLAQLKYGVSVTDACVGWETTEAMLRKAAERLRKGRR
ncbi:MAG TPA: 3-deoxy-7-phosphoheptulonate synthase [bacterium]|jgi:3-deoxy-7-phosphoheptulonate synthase|nr:3-deoxy-7-phosphoheptulonate synthase [bacterium]